MDTRLEQPTSLDTGERSSAQHHKKRQITSGKSGTLPSLILVYRLALTRDSRLH